MDRHGTTRCFHELEGAEIVLQITRQEMWELKTRFWRSKLSKLSNEELIKWLSDDKCVPTNMEVE